MDKNIKKNHSASNNLFLENSFHNFPIYSIAHITMIMKNTV